MEVEEEDFKMLYHRIAKMGIYMADEEFNEFFDDDLLKDLTKMEWILKECVKLNDILTMDFLLLNQKIFGLVNEHSQTPIHICAYAAVDKNNFEIVDLLFNHFDTTVNHVDDSGLSHFHVACMAGNTDAIEDMLDCANVDVNNHYWDNSGRYLTPLLLAVKFKRVEIVKLLLEFGANPNLVCSFGVSPLHLACGYINNNSEMKHSVDFTSYEISLNDDPELEMMKVLVDFGGKVNIQNCEGDTPMNNVFNVHHLETNSCYSKLVREFCIQRDVVQEIRNRQKNKVKFLLSNGADIRITNNNGSTILHLAIDDLKWCRQLRYLEAINFDDDILAEMLEIFLKYGADVNAKNNKGQSPLQLAVVLLSFKTVKILLNYSADVTSIRFDYFYYQKDIIPRLATVDDLVMIVDALLKKGFYLNQRSNLDILEFFVRNNSKYPNPIRDSTSNDKEIYWKIKNLLEFGSEHNITVSFKNATAKIFSSNKVTNTVIRQSMLSLIITQLMMIENDVLYANQEFKDFLRFAKSTLNVYSLDFIRASLSKTLKEIKAMKAVMLNKSTSLCDVMSTKPGRCHLRMKSCNYRSIVSSFDFRSKFFSTWGIMEGHFAKSLIRRYVVESARDYLAVLINLSLPDYCCDHIFDYLSNESLFNLCVAAVN